MLSPVDILPWLEANVNGVRLSRLKTLAAIVPAAMELEGVGVLALGRAMSGPVSGKHNIKRVNRFLGNEGLECTALAKGIFGAFAPRQGRVLVLADWTDVSNAKMLVFALPANGRSIPFYAYVVPKLAGEGTLIEAEDKALQALKEICAARSHVTVVADRGFGNKRWLGAVRKAGFHYVQRISSVFTVDTELFMGGVKEMNLRQGDRIRDWGYGTVGADEVIEGRVITAYDPKAKEPWYLVSDLDDAEAEEIVSIYRRRWWIETVFRDSKNRDWGMGLDMVNLKDFRRYERLFYIVALAFTLLSAHGALAEAEGVDKEAKANTRTTRVLNLLRIGIYYIKRRGQKMSDAVDALKILATAQAAPNWG